MSRMAQKQRTRKAQFLVVEKSTNFSESSLPGTPAMAFLMVSCVPSANSQDQFTTRALALSSVPPGLRPASLVMHSLPETPGSIAVKVAQMLPCSIVYSD